MASNPDFYAFPTGQSGLTPAVLPTGQGLDLQPLMTAIQQRMLNKYRADEINTQIQKLSQDAQQHESELQFKRDQLNAEADLRSAQAENYRAMAKYHNAAATDAASGEQKLWQHELSLAPQVADYTSQAEQINQTHIPGTQGWDSAMSTLNQSNARLLAESRRAAAFQKEYDMKGRTTATNLLGQQRQAAASLNGVLTNYGIKEPALDQLQNDVNNPGYADPNNPGNPNAVWGKRPDGSFYAYVTNDNERKTIPFSVGKDLWKKPDVAKNFTPVTILPQDVQPTLDLRKTVRSLSQGQNMIARRFINELSGQVDTGQQQPTKHSVYDQSSDDFKPYGTP